MWDRDTWWLCAQHAQWQRIPSLPITKQWSSASETWGLQAIHILYWEQGNARGEFISRVFSGREAALKVASKPSWDKNNLSLKPEWLKKAEQLFMYDWLNRLQHSIDEPHAQRRRKMPVVPKTAWRKQWGGRTLLRRGLQGSPVPPALPSWALANGFKNV